MRVLFLVDRLSSRGGADVHLLCVLEQLAARRHRLTVVAGQLDGGVLAPPGCEVSLLPSLAARRAVAPVGLERVAATARPDVIHVQNIVNPLVMRWAADRGALATVQDHRAFCPGRGKWTGVERCSSSFSRTSSQCRDCFAADADAYHLRIVELTWARLEALRRFSRVVVLSRYMRRELRAVGVARVSVIPPFVAPALLEEARQHPRETSAVICVGRVVSAKGIDDAIEVHRRAALALPLRFVGTGPERARVEGAGYEVSGWLDHRQLARRYRRAALLLLLPRWQEPFGIVGLEALACGVPVAAWQSGGIAEWHPATLPEWGDLDGAAELARSLCGARAGAPRGCHDPAVLTDQLEGLYRELRGAR